MTIRAVAFMLLLALVLMAATCDEPAKAPATADPEPTTATVEPLGPATTPDETTAPAHTPTPTPPPDNAATPTASPAPTPTAVTTAAPTQTPAPTPTPTAAPTPDGTASPTPTQAPSGNVANDREALVALYHATDGANWTNSRDWLSKEPIERWFGVWTNAAGRVRALWLSNSQLRGPLPPELGNLTGLKQLRLKDNQLSGPIPAELGRLANLVELVLNGNKLSGAIPAELGRLSNLEALHLHQNQFSGGIPSELGNLSSLKQLALAWNTLSGEIPPELGSISSLELLFLYRNQLTGPIPAEFGRLSNLAMLVLAENQLTGEIPPELGNLGNLKSLGLFQNQLSGSIPAELGNLSQLVSLALFENQLTGAIPSELGSLADLQALGLNENRLEGAIPPVLGSLVNLRRLDLSENRLEGTIPPELGSLVNLGHLDLSENRLSGPIPPELGGLANLKFLNLSGNSQITGCLPSEIDGRALVFLGNLRLPICGELPPVPAVVTVKFVRVGTTSVTIRSGHLSDRRALEELYHKTDGTNWANSRNWLSEAPLGDWHGVSTDADGRVAELRLDGNQLRGAIPPKLGQLSNLKVLTLGSNQLSGMIPPELGRLEDLTYLRLTSGNRFTGCVPSEWQDIQDSDVGELGLPFCGAGEGLESAAPAVNLDAEAESTPEAVEQTAVSRTGVPTVGATQLADDGLEVTLVSVQRFERLAQVHGSPFRPKNGLYLVVTIAFTNTNDSGNIVVSKANIVLIEPSGNEIAVDSPGVNALLGMASQETEGRPLFLVEAVPGGGTATVAVVFDIDPGLVDLEIDIEGFRFEVPNP